MYTYMYIIVYKCRRLLLFLQSRDIIDESNAQTTLDRFCLWSNNFYAKNKEKESNYDISIFLTRRNIGPAGNLLTDVADITFVTLIFCHMRALLETTWWEKVVEEILQQYDLSQSLYACHLSIIYVLSPYLPIPFILLSSHSFIPTLFFSLFFFISFFC